MFYLKSANVQHVARKISISLLWIAACLGDVPTFAGELPAPADLPNIERKTKPQPALQPNIQAAPEAYAPAAPENSEISVRLTEVKFFGNESISKESLSQITQHYLNRDVNFKDLNSLTAEISRYYQRQGFLLAQAYLPEQDIENGKLQINIIEGKLADLRTNTSSKLNQAFMQSMASFGMQTGDTLRENNLVRNLSVINALPGVKASAQLGPGERIGTSNVDIGVEETPWLSGFIGFNTFGNRFTGREVLEAGLFFNNLAGRGDQFRVNLSDSNSEKQRSVRLSYFVPVHASGTLLGLNINHLEYRLGREFRVLNAQGNSQQFAASLDQPILRNKKQNLSGRLAVLQKHVQDDVDAFDLSIDRKINALDIALYGDWQDSVFNGLTLANVNLRSGRLDFKNNLAENLDRTGARTEGGFSKLNLFASRSQPLFLGMVFTARGEVQWADKNLDNSEKLALGGINRWRDFGELPTSVDRGWQTGLELRRTFYPGAEKKLPIDTVSPYVFTDYAEGRINQKALSASNQAYSHQYGVGIDMVIAKQWNVGLTATHQTRNIKGSIEESESRLWGVLQYGF